MPVLPGAEGDVGAKLNVILGHLKNLEAGQARIANLHSAVEARHIRADQLRELATVQRPSSGIFDTYAALLTHIRELSPVLYFQRPSPPRWDHPVALVLERALLDEGKQFHLFSADYIADAKSKRAVPQKIGSASELADLLAYIRKGFRQGLGTAGLGEPFRRGDPVAKAGPGGQTGVAAKPSGRVVFVTPVDEFWDRLTAERFKADSDALPNPGLANRICDLLGLPYRDNWLVELRSRLTLRELVDRGQLTLAAPTVIEAWVHDFFRQWPREGDDEWGRTLHICDGPVGRADPQGLPEAIIDYLPPGLLSEAFEVSILGQLTRRPVPLQREVNEFLIAERELATLIESIVSRVSP